ncbi:DUF397 domain-containing protein [Actinocorallia sp. API 0066]|uniref:DUF397 domain-containing protein n=1 Tax=Actinocorallia sp. API 0066 TaxID=2896846 RepID=UPI001E3B82D5|nr:DUF397 domain-containing protein [Actinocorallia sp. API 0066]MCD0453357.1 DUF397 domain-containing protein [Actinocorallia sp. API 0066]
MQPLNFRKSSHSQERQCVEVADGGSTVVVRDSKDTAGPTLAFSRSAWSTFAKKI